MLAYLLRVSYIKTGTLKLQVGLLENASMENRSAKGKTCKGGKYKYGKIKYYCARAENASTEKASASEQGQYYSTYSVLYRLVGRLGSDIWITKLQQRLKPHRNPPAKKSV